MNKYDYEVIIIGGGPAGSSAAIYLRSLGFEVCIIEKKPFPRETLCGEFLSAEVINCVTELGLFEKFIDAAPNHIKSFSFFNDNRKNISTALKFPAYGMKRGTFDTLLLEGAKEKGVEIIQPAEVTAISRVNDEFSVIIAAEGEEERSLKSQFVIGAYGRQNALDKNLGRRFVNNKSKLNGIKFHVDFSLLKDFNKEEIHVYAADGIYCGVNAVNDNCVTICFLEDRNILKYSPREQLIKLQEKNSFFENLFSYDFESVLDTLPVYGTGNIYFGKREHVVNGVYMIGDAAGVIAPLAGDGIGMAMESAKLIAGVLGKSKNKKMETLKAQSVYESAWNRKFRKRLRTAMMIQNFILKGALRNPGFKVVKLFPFLLPLLVKNTRT